MHACVLDLIDCHKTTGARRKHSPAERARYLNIIPVRCPMPEETNCRRHHLLAADGDKPRTRRAGGVACRGNIFKHQRRRRECDASGRAAVALWQLTLPLGSNGLSTPTPVNYPSPINPYSNKWIIV